MTTIKAGISLFFAMLYFGHYCCASAALPSYENLTTANGLPSNEVYEVFEDLNGYLWFTTDRGIARYDSYHFSLYSTENGLAFNTNFKFLSDTNGTFWANGYDGSLTYWNGEYFEAFPFNQKIQSLLLSKEWIEPFHLDSAWIYCAIVSRNQYLAVHKKSGEIKNLPANYLQKHNLLQLSSDFQYGNLHEVFLPRLNTENQRLYSYYSKNQDATAQHEKRIELKDLKSLAPAGTRLLDVAIDQHQRMWLATNQGLYLQNLHEPESGRWLFKGISISSIFEDHEGNTWLTTIGHGVFLIRSVEIELVFQNTDKNVNQLEPKQDQLLLLTQQNEVLALDSQLQIQPYAGVFKPLLSTADKLQDNRVQTIVDHPDSAHTFYWRCANNYPISLSFVYFRVFSDTFYSEVDTFIFINQKAALIDPEKEIWLGTKKGLAHGLVTKSGVHFSLIESGSLGSSTRINALCESTTGQLFVGTLGQGVFYQQGEEFIQLVHPQMKSLFVNQMLLENDSTLWVATNHGLNRIRFRTDGGRFVLVSAIGFSRESGLPDSYVLDLCLWQGHFWLATSAGVSRFASDVLTKVETPPRLLLSSIQVGEVPMNLDDPKLMQLAHTQSDVRFEYTGITNFKPTNGNFSYRFRLRKRSANTKWTYTNQRVLQFTNLDPASYHFEVQCQNMHGVWSEFLVVPFKISPHFSQTAWFQALMLFLSFLLIGGVSFLRVRSIKSRIAQKVLLQEAELAVLKTQMNPHFIFNSLNAVQNFILKGKALEANTFLGNFAALIRDSLGFSRQKSIPIQQEIDFLTNYLTLEQVRYRQSFSFEIECDPSVDSAWHIPPMMVQPLAENAVKHAFRGLDRPGVLKVYMVESFNRETLTIRISDNGKGLSQSDFDQTTISNSHRSVGLKILRERLHYFNTIFPLSKGRLQWLPNNEQQGTTIELIVPIISPKND